MMPGHSERRYGGIHPGIIRDINDPENLKRVRLQIPNLFGASLTNWSFPTAPTQAGTAPASLTVPPVGTNVWVMFVNSDPDYPVWISG